MTMRYQVLGPLRIVAHDKALSVGAPRPERLLAILLLRANQIVPISQLIGGIWGEERPERATQGIHVYISQLRKVLATAGLGNPIVTRPPGYLFEAGPEDIDWFVFRRLVRTGRTHYATNRLPEAARAFDEALALWRMPGLGRMYDDEPGIAGYANALDELRIECVELRNEVGLRIGEHRSLISPLHMLISDYPLYEEFYGQLMRALCLSNRRADALAVYRKAWDVLDRELGLEPSEMLKDLNNSILTTGTQRHLRIA